MRQVTTIRGAIRLPLNDFFEWQLLHGQNSCFWSQGFYFIFGELIHVLGRWDRPKTMTILYDYEVIYTKGDYHPYWLMDMKTRDLHTSDTFQSPSDIMVFRIFKPETHVRAAVLIKKLKEYDRKNERKA